MPRELRNASRAHQHNSFLAGCYSLTVDGRLTMTHEHDLRLPKTRSYPITLSRRAFIAAGVGAAAAAMAKWQGGPDLGLHKGALWTVGDPGPEGEAICLRGGRLTPPGTHAPN